MLKKQGVNKITIGYTLTGNFVPVPKDILRKASSMGFSKQEQEKKNVKDHTGQDLPIEAIEIDG